MGGFGVSCGGDSCDLVNDVIPLRRVRRVYLETLLALPAVGMPVAYASGGATVATTASFKAVGVRVGLLVLHLNPDDFKLGVFDGAGAYHLRGLWGLWGLRGQSVLLVLAVRL